MIGPIANGAALVVGSVAGAMIGPRLDKNLRQNIPLVFACAEMGIGILMIVKVHAIAPVILALILGTAFGEIVRFEARIQKGAGGLRKWVEKLVKPTGDIAQSEFLDKFVALTVLFCASGVGIYGSLHEGMTGDASLLYVKAILDFFTGLIFAASMGLSIALLALPQFVIQALLFLCAVLILPLISAHQMADFTGCGGLIMLATGFRMCGIKPFPVANMLPALIIVMPLTWLWGFIA